MNVKAVRRTVLDQFGLTPPVLPTALPTNDRYRHARLALWRWCNSRALYQPPDKIRLCTDDVMPYNLPPRPLGARGGLPC